MGHFSLQQKLTKHWKSTTIKQLKNSLGGSEISVGLSSAIFICCSCFKRLGSGTARGEPPASFQDASLWHDLRVSPAQADAVLCPSVPRAPLPCPLAICLVYRYNLCISFAAFVKLLFIFLLQSKSFPGLRPLTPAQ